MSILLHEPDTDGILRLTLNDPAKHNAFLRTHFRDEFWAHFGGEPEAPFSRAQAAVG